MTDKWIIGAVILLLLGCSEKEVTKHTAGYISAWQGAVFSSDVQQKWQRSCAMCHVSGEGGAPRMGDDEIWQSRLEKGPVALLKNTVKGINRMPPLGYCMDCEVEDFAAMIRMMSGDIK
ncbi:MAG: cytochrome c5 family protein [Gammaproteobacteria bacterium]|jgi:cytochrome c5|nr:cytochrome c5 family protein [Gammaproteobacteria bacterium]MBT4494959.1 cytochrome c5 family protein [Gammaproteobacteria bacterium]MBT7370683.1 cytochrome c5 family protein [Gammaproteobacteria bacterium]